MQPDLPLNPQALALLQTFLATARPPAADGVPPPVAKRTKKKQTTPSGAAARPPAALSEEDAEDQPNPGRNARGRFTEGNKGGPGNPFARQCAAFRRAIHEAVKPEDIQELTWLLLALAKGGNLAAIKMVFEYTVGKPTPAVDPDTLDIRELQLFQGQATTTETLAPIIQGISAQLACLMLRAAVPALQEAQQQLAGEVLSAPDPRAALRQVEEEMLDRQEEDEDLDEDDRDDTDLEEDDLDALTPEPAQPPAAKETRRHQTAKTSPVKPRKAATKNGQHRSGKRPGTNRANGKAPSANGTHGKASSSNGVNGRHGQGASASGERPATEPPRSCQRKRPRSP